MASQDQSSEARELGLVGKVEMRIALSDTDQKLETVLKTYLAPLLLKLASESASVRKKVLSICQHLHIRLKPQSIQLPVHALLKQYKEQSDAPLVRRFDLVFIEQGIRRLQSSQKVELFPTLAHGISKDASRDTDRGARIFQLFLELLPLLQLPLRGSQEDEELRTKFNIEANDGQFLSMWLGKLLLLNTAKPYSVANKVTPAGLSESDLEVISMRSGTSIWRTASEGGLSLVEIKVAASRFVASGALTDNERFLPGLFASTDANPDVSEIGNEILKRIIDTIDLEDDKLVLQLYDLYMAKGATPASPVVKSKILSLLSRSRKSTEYASHILRIVEEQFDEDASKTSNTSSQPSIGRENKKLWSSLFTFLNHVARNSSPSTLKIIAPQLVKTLMRVSDQEHTSKSSSESFMYEAIALLAKASPPLLIEPELAILSWVLKKLEGRKADKSIADSLEEALATILGAYVVALPPKVEEALGTLLLKRAIASHPRFQTADNGISKSTRYIITRFANQCLPYDNLKGRWIDILAIAGNARDNHEIFEEGRRGLDPYWHNVLRQNILPKPSENVEDRHERPLFPSFASTVQAFFTNLPFGKRKSTDLDHDEIVEDFTTLLGFEPLKAALQFTRMVLVNEALTSKNIKSKVNVDTERALHNSITSSPDDRLKIKAYLSTYVQTPSNELALSRLLDVALGSFLQDDESAVEPGQVLLNILSLSPSDTISGLTSRFRRLEKLILSNNVKVRELAGQIYGVLASHPSAADNDRTQSIEALFQRIVAWEAAIGSEINRAHGAIVTIAFFYSRLNFRCTIATEYEINIQRYLTLMLSILKSSKDRTLQDACFDALRELSTFYVLEPHVICANASFESTIGRILEAAKVGNEKAIISLGRLGMIFPEHDGEKSEISYVVEQLRELHTLRQIDVQFSVGEALTCVAAGWQSEALKATLDIDGESPKKDERRNTLQRVLKSTLVDCRSPKPSLKKAALIWLLCFVQFCGQTGEVQDLLWECQNAFKQGLIHRDEFVQETASRGLGIIYKTGSQDIKADLVRDLVSSFSDNKARLAGSVTAETQLFEPGALPTGEGSVSTYKDIMSLASEVGDSSLVYRFMSLASNNALWSSRVSYGRFALTSIFADSNAENFLSENPKLYTKLYRYRFDPNPNVQRAMRDIWNALVPDTNKAVEKHFDKILTDLLDNALVREWRVRQASIDGIAELVQSRKLELFQDFLARIWEVTFKVLDDIKETVRRAAGGLARVMTNLVTRGLEAGAASSQKTLSHVLPFLLSTSGLESNVEDAQAFALKALLDIVKKSDAKTLRPFLPDTIEKLTRLLSSLEPQAINYVHLNADKYKLTTGEIDDMRMKSIRGSPLTEAIERCLDYLDENSMVKLYPRLEDIMKTGVGLPSKVGLCRIFVSLSTRHNHLLGQYADRCLNLLSRNLIDRNETVSSSYAAATGFVSRKASGEQILKLIDRCKSLYYRSEDKRSREISGEVVVALSDNATDRFQALAGDILPFVFFAMNDTDERVRKNFKDAWDNNVAGPRAIRLYLPDILAIVQVHMDSNMWNLKHSAARATSGVIKAIVTSGDVRLSDFQLIWPAAEKAVSGKTWDGKEEILESFTQFVKQTQHSVLEKSEKIDDIVKITLREARRNNQTYRPYSLKCLGDIALTLDNINFREEVIRTVDPIMQEIKGSRMEIDQESETPDQTIQEMTLKSCVNTLIDSVNPKIITEKDLTAYLMKVINCILLCNDMIKASMWKGFFEHLQMLFLRIKKNNVKISGYENDEELAILFEKLFFYSLEDLNEAAQTSRIEAIETAVEIQWPGIAKLLKTRLPGEVARERSSLNRKRLEQLIQ